MADFGSDISPTLYWAPEKSLGHGYSVISHFCDLFELKLYVIKQKVGNSSKICFHVKQNDFVGLAGMILQGGGGGGMCPSDPPPPPPLGSYTYAPPLILLRAPSAFQVSPFPRPTLSVDPSPD